MFGQLPKILATILGWYIVEPICMMDHIQLASLHSKNKCLIFWSLWQKTHYLLPSQLRLVGLSLVRIIPRRKYHAKTLFFVKFSSSRFSYYYQPAHLAGLMSCTWSPPRIYHYCVNSTETRRTLVSNWQKLDTIATRAKLLVWYQQDLSWMSRLDAHKPTLERAYRFVTSTDDVI